MWAWAAAAWLMAGHPAIGAEPCLKSVRETNGFERPDARENLCWSRKLGFKNATVLWRKSLESHILQKADRLKLSGEGREPDFKPGSISSMGPEETKPSAFSALPLKIDLVPRLKTVPFRREERANVTQSQDSVMFHCRPGREPAGWIFDPGPYRRPRLSTVEIASSFTGGEGFKMGIASAGREPEPWFPLKQGENRSPVPQPRGDESLSFVVACSLEDARGEWKSVRLDAPPLAGPRPGRAAWAWEPRRWHEDPATLLDEAARLSIDHLFVTALIENDAVALSDEFQSFIRLAHRYAIAVSAVEGDPAFALPAGRTLALSRLAALERYQKDAPPDAKLDGLQYDIEPYILPLFSTDPKTVLNGWRETVLAIGAEASLPVDIVLPFWLSDDGVLSAIARTARSITVMAYRTNAESVQDAAEPLLAWGTDHGLDVRIALEAGPVADEAARFYSAASRGTLHIVREKNGLVALLLDRETRSNNAFALAGTSLFPKEKISFLKNGEALNRILKTTEPVFRAWRGYRGWALHGML